MTEDAVTAIVGRVRLVPERYKCFAEPEDVAARRYHLDPDLLGRLLDAGLPHRGRAGLRRYDALDLDNIGLALELPTPRRRAMRWWSRTLLRDGTDTDVRCPVTVTARCPAPGHPGRCAFTLSRRLLAAAAGSVRRDGARGAAYTLDAVLPGASGTVGGPFTALFTRLAALRFHVLPDTMDDVGWGLDTGLASCALATRIAVRLGTADGLPVRSAFGYFVTVPYLTLHAWCEYRPAGRWVPADPFFLTALARWRVPGSERWPADRIIAPLVWRLADQDTAALARPFHPVTHHGVAAPASLSCRWPGPA